MSSKRRGRRTRVHRGAPMTSSPPPMALSVIHSEGGVSRMRVMGVGPLGCRLGLLPGVECHVSHR